MLEESLGSSLTFTSLQSRGVASKPANTGTFSSYIGETFSLFSAAKAGMENKSKDVILITTAKTNFLKAFI